MALGSKNLTKTLLWVVLSALALSAAAGIFVILTGGEPPWQVIASLLSIGLFSLTSLGASIVLLRGIWKPAMLTAWVLSMAGLAIYLLIIWLQPRSGEDFIYRTMGLLTIWSIALPHAGLLSLTRFEGPWAAVRLASFTVLFSLAISLSVHVFGAHDHWQLTAVLSILAGLATIGLPVAQKLYGLANEPPGLESTPAQVWLRCPRCELEQTVSAGKSKCSGCDLRIELKVEEPRCGGCGYLLYKLTSPACPECGRPV